MTTYLVIDAGGTFLKSAIMISEGNVLPDSSFSIKSNSEGTIEEILQAFGKVFSQGLNYIQNYNMKLGGIGIAFPGPFNIEQATPLMKHKFQSIYGLNLREYFYETIEISRDIPIQFIHDANAVLLGELWKGKAKGYKNASVITLGTGLGFAISRDGEVLCNEIGGPYLSIFKTPYKEGILEDYTAKRGFLKIYGELINQKLNDNFTVADIADLAKNGETAAIETFKRIGGVLAGILHDIFLENKIECLLFSGQISKSFQYMESALKKGLYDIHGITMISTVENIDYSALLGTLKNLLKAIH